MRRFRQAYLHVGLHKTGTTAIQTTLWENRSLLENRDGVLYPSVNPNHSVPVYSIFCAAPEKYHINIKAGRVTRESCVAHNAQLRSELDADFARTRADRLLMSGEDISTLKVPELVALRRWLEQHCDSVRVICFLRNPLDWEISVCQEKIKGGETFEKLISRPGPHIAYRQVLEKFIEVFGSDNLAVHDFDRERDRPGGLMRAFCEAVDLPAAEFPARSLSNRNESMSLEAALLLSELNKLVPWSEDAASSGRRHAADYKPFLALTGTRFKVPVEYMDKIRDKVHRDKEWIRQQFGLDWGDDIDQSTADALSFDMNTVCVGRDTLAQIALTIHQQHTARRDATRALSDARQKLLSLMQRT